MLLSLDGRDLEVFRNAMPNGGFVITCLDVTRRAQAEATVRQAQKMEAVGHLTGGMAHDFNNLLQVITGNLELLARAAPLQGRAAVHLASALGGAERGARLTAQLLAFARQQPLDPRVINLGRQVRDMTDLLRRTLGEQIEVEASVAGGLWNTLADPGQVENALLNLAINGRDAMPDGGKLTIELANAFLDDSYADSHLEVLPGQYVMLAVSDTGSGMSPEVAARVFEPFFTTKAEGEGTGLGLSQVYGFVKQSGGHIKLYSELSQGTTVKLYLPRSRRPADITEAPLAGPIEGGTETILVVEDDAAVREAVVEILTDLGYSVLKAGDAEAALSVLSSGARVDLLFTDVVMPGPVKTRDLARRAQALLPGLKVLYTSGYTANAIIHDGRLDADVLLLSKPYRRDELARRVRRVLGSPAAVPTHAVWPFRPGPGSRLHPPASRPWLADRQPRAGGRGRHDDPHEPGADAGGAALQGRRGGDGGTGACAAGPGSGPLHPDHRYHAARHERAGAGGGGAATTAIPAVADLHRLYRRRCHPAAGAGGAGELPQQALQHGAVGDRPGGTAEGHRLSRCFPLRPAALAPHARAMHAGILLLAVLVCTPPLPASAQGTPPVSPATRRAELDRLLDSLAKAADPIATAQALESRIRALWMQAASPAVVLLMQRGSRNLEADADADAVEDFDAALVLQPDFTDAWLLRAAALSATGDTAAAARDLRQALVLEPRRFDALDLLSRIQEQSGDLPGALRSLQAAVAIHPRMAGAEARIRQLRQKIEGQAT
jgi:signal transduction histidine kinase/CheY-like chemotaxis protein